MCGKDGTQRGVYKLKEEHEKKGDRNRKRKGRETQTKKEESKSREEELHGSLKKTIVVPTLDL